MAKKVADTSLSRIDGLLENLFFFKVADHCLTQTPSTNAWQISMDWYRNEILRKETRSQKGFGGKKSFTLGEKEILPAEENILSLSL